jgi:hypothetical protein
MNRFVLISVLAALMLGAQAHAQKVYKWTDENGQVHFGTAPPAKQNAQAVRLRSAPPPPAPAATEAAPADAANPGETTGAQASTEMTAERRAELTSYCKDIRARISTLSQSNRRIFVTNPDGSSERLDPTRINTEMQSARANESKFCTANGM